MMTSTFRQGFEETSVLKSKSLQCMNSQKKKRKFDINICRKKNLNQCGYIL